MSNTIILEDAYEKFSKQLRDNMYIPSRVDMDLVTGMEIIKLIGCTLKKEFVIDKNNQEAFEQLFWYFTGQFEHFNGNPDKGICAIGKKGSGKTLAMEIMRLFLHFLADNGVLKPGTFKPFFRIVKTTEIKSNFSDQENGGMKTLKPYKTRHDVYCFDDILEEVRTKDNTLAVHFAVKLNVIENIFTQRVENMKVFHTLTHATSNYPIQSSDSSQKYWEMAYGDRIADRGVEMFNVIFFYGESRRK